MRITDCGFPTWLTGDEWQRVDQIRELVKQDGDARCEAAFDDLHVEIQALRAQLAAVERDRDRAEQKFHQYRDVWLERGFPLDAGDKPDVMGTVVGLNTTNLMLTAQLAAAEARVTALEGALRAAEWAWDKERAIQWCPVCERIRGFGHTKECSTAAALRATPGERE